MNKWLERKSAEIFLQKEEQNLQIDKINHRMHRNRSKSHLQSTSSSMIDPLILQKNLQIKIVKKIGSGLTAKVYEVHHAIHGKTSLKVIQNNFSKTKVGAKLVKNEIEILKLIQRNQNIIHMYEYIYKDKKYGEDLAMILTNFCEGGDLEKKIIQAKYLSVPYSLKIFEGLLKAVQYLFSKNILHRDIKPANIFLKNNSKTPVLADFGFAIRDDDKEMRELNVGSPLYMAPQSLQFKHFSEKTDIFALGVVLYEMLMGKTPWNAASEKDLLKKMKTTLPIFSASIPKQLKNIIGKCLSANENQRPIMKQLCKEIKLIMSRECSSSAETNQEKQRKQSLNKNLQSISEEKQHCQNEKQKKDQNKIRESSPIFKPLTIEPKKNLSKEKYNTFSNTLNSSLYGKFCLKKNSKSISLKENSSHQFFNASISLKSEKQNMFFFQDPILSKLKQNQSVQSKHFENQKRKTEQKKGLNLTITANKQNPKIFPITSTTPSSCLVSNRKISSTLPLRNNNSNLGNKKIQIQGPSHCKNDKINLFSNAEKNNQQIQKTFLKTLTEIKPQIFTFLPNSLINKFNFILRKYNQILTVEETMLKNKKIEKITLDSQEQKDLQIQEINCCDSEESLCKNIGGFVRRLYRLAKNYKGFKKEIGNLEILYQRVTIMGH